MGAAGRGRDPHLIDALAGGGRRFNLFQLVRLLRHANRTGPAGDGRDGGIRFRTPATLVYPSSAVGAVEPPKAGAGDWSVTVNVLGLTGPGGILPLHYTHELIARAVEGDHAAEVFFDLFNQRLVELHYRAWERTKLHVRHERGDPDGPARRLLGVAGLGTPGLGEALDDGSGGLTANAAAYFAGLFGQLPRSAQAVRQVLADLLGAPVAVEQFVGVWLMLPEECRTRLGGGGTPHPAAALGNVVLGACVWDRRSTLRVRIGPLGRARFAAFLPRRDGPSPAFRALATALSALLGVSVRVQVQLVLRADQVPALRLGGGDGHGGDGMPAILGRSAWLPGRTDGRDADDTVLE